MVATRPSSSTRPHEIAAIGASFVLAIMSMVFLNIYSPYEGPPPANLAYHVPFMVFVALAQFVLSMVYGWVCVFSYVTTPPVTRVVLNCVGFVLNIVGFALTVAMMAIASGVS